MCNIEIRTTAQLAAAIDAIETNPNVVAAEDVTDLDVPTVIEVVLYPHCRRVPPALERTFADHDLGIHDVSPQGEPPHLIVAVR